MKNNTIFKENIKKIKDITSTKRWFKKTNPNVRLCFFVLPKRLQLTANFIFTSIEKDIFYHKNIRSDIWSKKSISAYDIMSFCSDNFSSEKSAYYYNKIIKELIDLNVIYEYRYCYSKKHNMTIRLFTIEQKIYQWKLWDASTPILPSTVVRIIRSNHEICKKTFCMIHQINKKFTMEKSMTHFADYIYKKMISKMLPDIANNIKPFRELKKEITVYEYLNSYLLSELHKFDKFHGLNEDVITKIVEKDPELINKLFTQNESENLKKISEYNDKKTLVAHQKDSISFEIDNLSYKQKNACSSSCQTTSNDISNNELQKVSVVSTDIRKKSYKDSLYNLNNKEYNKDIDMKKKRSKTEDDKHGKNITARGKQEMKNMCINDIIPENDSFRKIKKNYKIKKDNSVKKYRNHKDGWIFNGLTGQVLGSRKDFIAMFKKIIKKYHKDIVFSNHEGYYAREMSNAGWIMDDLIKRDCNNESIVAEWMEWYAQAYLRNKKINDLKYLSIEFLRKTWDAFDKVRRKDVLIINPIKSSVMNEDSISFRINKMFNNNHSDENILKALKFFGVIIVAHYLQNKFGESYNVTSKIDSIFEKIYINNDQKPTIVSIFNSTCKFLCDFINTKNTILQNWVERYNKAWSISGCNFEFYKKNNILIASEKNIAEDFFKDIYDNVETK